MKLASYVHFSSHRDLSGSTGCLLLLTVLLLGHIDTTREYRLQ